MIKVAVMASIGDDEAAVERDNRAARSIVEC